MQWYRKEVRKKTDENNINRWKMLNRNVAVQKYDAT